MFCSHQQEWKDEKRKVKEEKKVSVHFLITQNSLLRIWFIFSQKCPKSPLKGLALWASEVRECSALLALSLPHFFSFVGSSVTLFNFGAKRFWKSFEDLIWKEVQVGSHQWNNFLWNFLVNFVYMLIFSALLDWIPLILAWIALILASLSLKTDDFMATARNVDQHGQFNTGTSALSGLLC